jgi:hypothetical protein
VLFRRYGKWAAPPVWECCRSINLFRCFFINPLGCAFPEVRQMGCTRLLGNADVAVVIVSASLRYRALSIVSRRAKAHLPHLRNRSVA